MKHLTISDLSAIYHKMLHGRATKKEKKAFKNAQLTVAIDINKLKRMVEYERNNKK